MYGLLHSYFSTNNSTTNSIRKYGVCCHAKCGPDEKWTGGPLMATKSGPGGPLLVAIIGPPVHFSSQKAVPPSEKWTGCSFRSLARLWGYKTITNDTFMTVLCHDGEFRLLCDSHHQRDSWPRYRYRFAAFSVKIVLLVILPLP